MQCWFCFVQVMVDVLIEIINDLASINVGNDTIVNGKRMLSAFVVICFFNDMIPVHIQTYKIPAFRISTLLSLFCLLPDTQSRICSDWDYLKRNIPATFIETIYKALQRFIDHLKDKDYIQPPKWLFAVPTLHFLKKLSYPFQEIEYDVKNIQWEREFASAKMPQ